MASGIYLIQDDDRLVEMREQAYDSEALLQELLAKYPNLLAGDQMASGEPRRWLLIARELGVPGEEEGNARWAVDHLFLDQDAIPTIVEVKRSSDTRIRREVVGQMLDYAANAVAYWPVESVRAAFERRCEHDGLDPDEVLAAHLGPTSDGETFWQSAKTNLQAGRVRLVFVADQIPPELRRVVEFLNSQMDPGEVLAVEIKQFVGENLRTLVPRVIGLTAEAQQKKSAGAPGRMWDEASFFGEMEKLCAGGEVATARRVLEWLRRKGLRITWGRGRTSASMIPILDLAGRKHRIASLWPQGTVEVQFELLKERAPFNDDLKRRELLRRLNSIPGVSLPEDSIGKRPTFSLQLVSDDRHLEQLLAVLDWTIEEIKKVAGSAEDAG